MKFRNVLDYSKVKEETIKNLDLKEKELENRNIDGSKD